MSDFLDVQDDRTAREQGRRLIGLAVGLGIVLVAIAVALVFALTGDSADDRTLRRVAALHLLQPTDPPPGVGGRGGPGVPPGPPPIDGVPAPPPPPDAEPPPPRRGSPGAVTARILDGGWRPTGVRSDTVDGLAVETIIYSRRGQRLGHSLIVGDPQPPEPVRRLGRGGVLLLSFEDGPVTAVTWSRAGVAEVLAGAGLERTLLYELAAGPV